MTNQEFSNSFDTLIGAYSSDDTIGYLTFDEYEKSVFLTRAQEDIIIGFYNGNNLLRGSFENTEEIRRYLSTLVKTSYAYANDKKSRLGISDKSVFFTLPDDLWFITYESCNLEDTTKDIDSPCRLLKSVTVVPILQDDYHKLKKNPFRGPNSKRVLRLDIEENHVELISSYPIKDYIIRYIAKPSPIILADLGDLSINGVNEETECSLNPIIHKFILDRAIELALASRSIRKQ